MSILDGIRIADFSEYIAGPYCAMVLGDLGAEVVKVEPPGGDRWRQSFPLEENEGRGYLQVNRGKRSIVLDLKQHEGRAIARKLISTCDAIVVNGRQAALKRLGLDYPALARRNPRLVYAQIAGFGTGGPYAHRGAFDLIAQAASGMLVNEGTVTKSTTGVTVSALGDYSAGLFLALGIVGALLARERTGRGQVVRTNLFDAAIACQYRPLLQVQRYDEAARLDFLAEAKEIIASGAGLDAVLAARAARLQQTLWNAYYRVYRTKDGFITVACLNNKLRRSFAKIVGFQDQSITGQGYSGTRQQESDALKAAVEPVLRKKTTAEWFALFEKVGIPCGPVNLPEGLIDDPQVRHNGSMLSLKHRRLGTVRMPANPLRYSRTRMAKPSAPPALGNATRSVLEELGYSKQRIRKLASEGIVALEAARHARV